VTSVPTEANAPFVAVYCCHRWSCPQLLAIIQRTTNPLTSCNLTKNKSWKYFFCTIIIIVIVVVIIIIGCTAVGEPWPPLFFEVS